MKKQILRGLVLPLLIISCQKEEVQIQTQNVQQLQKQIDSLKQIVNADVEKKENEKQKEKEKEKEKFDIDKAKNRAKEFVDAYSKGKFPKKIASQKFNKIYKSYYKACYEGMGDGKGNHKYVDEYGNDLWCDGDYVILESMEAWEYFKVDRVLYSDDNTAFVRIKGCFDNVCEDIVVKVIKDEKGDYLVDGSGYLNIPRTYYN